MHSQPELLRRVGLFGAIMLGLGAIVGTGVFVSIGLAAGVTGHAVVAAIAVAAVVAGCNGLSSAQLAANHPLSGGTYEYGYRWLHPRLGFIAGWMFLSAKSASAATAALGCAGYIQQACQIPVSGFTTALPCLLVVLMTAVVAAGIQRSNQVNLIMVGTTLLALGLLVLAGVTGTVAKEMESQPSSFFTGAGDADRGLRFLEAVALMFVAFTGYGRIATLGEEVQQPRKTIPRAIIITLVTAAGLYMAVSWVAVSTIGPQQLAEATLGSGAPLQEVASRLSLGIISSELLSNLVSLGAITAMVSVLLNLILGLSRVVLAMARRHDLPRWFQQIDGRTATPLPAVIVTGLVISLLTLVGDIKTTWSFSAFAVLVYYAITNLAATRLTDAERLYPPAIAWVGFIACLSLAFWVDRAIWLIGLGLLMGLMLVFSGLKWLKPLADERLRP